jgi:hypothetical protein
LALANHHKIGSAVKQLIYQVSPRVVPQPIQVLNFASAKDLHPIGVNQVQVPYQCGSGSFRLRILDGTIVILPTAYPLQFQFALQGLKQGADGGIYVHADSCC